MRSGTTNFSSLKGLMVVFYGIVYFNHVGLWCGTVSESHSFTQFIFGRSCESFLR